ncbi:MAG: PTS cellobiose transporter subunit IIC [Turicibacter sp.]|nr:PTS cellobiose transporter subunit IIC [Turicibacter sp.]
MEQTGGFFGFLEKNIMGPLGKMSQFKVVQGIMGAGMATIPFTIVGAMFLVLDIIPFTFPALEGFFNATFTPLGALYMSAFRASMGVLTLYFVLGMGYTLTKIYADEEGINLNPLTGAFMSMFAFLLIHSHFIIEDGAFEMTDRGWGRLEAAGIFPGIVMAVLAVMLYRMCIKRGWAIKMPDEVPEGVSRAFTALIPVAVTAIVVLVLNGLIIWISGMDLFELIAWPFGFVRHLTNNVFGIAVIYFLIHALWIVGIHGAQVIGAVTGPIVLTNLAYNQARFDAMRDGYAGYADMPFYAFAGQFQSAFVVFGGSGATLALTLMMIFLAKSSQLKILGRAAIGAGIFNINEPIIFGVPMIYNPTLALPFFLAPMISGMIAFLAIDFGLVQFLVAEYPWPTPMMLGAFIGTGGAWTAVVLAVVIFAVQAVIYFPFFKAYDKQLVAEEQANAAA